MSNSQLVTYTKISPNKTVPRINVIDTITIHVVVGQVTVERLGEIFANPDRNASSNYGVGYDGNIGMYCEEKDRSWCSSSKSNDNRAITVEVASDNFHPYKVTDEALYGLIELCADICKRNGIKELKWQGDKSLIGQVDEQNMTVHRWFAAKACPGDYLYDLHGEIARRVNLILNGGGDMNTTRIYGSNRFGTAAAISQVEYPNGCKNVVIATGEKFPDGLAGGPLATKMDAPILFVKQNSLPIETKDEIIRLGAINCIILGGESAVSQDVQDELENI